MLRVMALCAKHSESGPESARWWVLIGLVVLLCGCAGIWFEGTREEFATRRALKALRYPDLPSIHRGPDAIYWLSFARDMIDSGIPRNRFTRMDNAPFGRPNISWAALTGWHIVAVAKVWSLVTGLPVRDAIIPAGRWANPLLYLAMLAGLLMAGWRKAAAAPATMAALALATAPQAFIDFGYSAPDHHGWHDLVAFVMLACLAEALASGPGGLRWFVLAGVATAVAMWLGATVEAVPITGGCLGALAGMLFRRTSATGETGMNAASGMPDPTGWRWFGVTAAIGSLLFWLFESATPFLPVRLEVNHPYFSLGLLAGGEFLCRAQRLFCGVPSRCPRGDRAFLVLTGLVLALLAAGCAAGPAEWHVMRQPFMNRIHLLTAEGRPIVRQQGWCCLFAWGTPAFLFAWSVVAASRRELLVRDRMALLLCAVPVGLCLAATLLQQRWAGPSAAAAAALAAVLYSRRSRVDDPLRNDVWWRRIGLIIPLASMTVWVGLRVGDISGQVKSMVAEQVATMDIAGAILRDAEATGTPPIVVCSGQEARQAWLGFVAGIPAVATIFWDNPDGLRDHMTFLAGAADEASLRIARKRGITHVITTPEGGVVMAQHYVLHGNREMASVRKTLAYRLAAPTPDPPTWLKPLEVESTAVKALGIRIYRVVR